MEGRGSVMKQFKVMDGSKKKKHLLLYESYESFIRKCKSKFNITEDLNVFFVLEEDEYTEVDCDILEKLAPEKSVLIIKVEEQNDEEPAQNENNDHIQILEEIQDDHREKHVQSDREECRFEQMKNSEEITEKKKNDQIPENLTHEDCQGTTNTDNSSDFEVWDTLEEGAEVKEHLAKHGLNNIGDILKKQLNKWRQIPINIAVTGAPGKGKSSFINALRRLTEQDPGAAEVNVKECTMTVTPFQHPEYENLVIWDVPGVGTKNFPKENYLETINVDRYDFFIVVTTERFTEIDSWLLNEVACRNKHCYTIRTKIDIDLANEKRKVQGDFDEMIFFNRLKKELLQEVIDSVDEGTKFEFFAISNHYPMKYDFPKLQEQLLKDVPHAKKKAMVFDMAGLSANVVEAKADALRSRMWKVAVLSGVSAAIPLPICLDATVVLKEIHFYQSQFALDDSSLEKLAEISGVNLTTMKEEIKFQTPSTLFSFEGIFKFLETHGSELSLDSMSSLPIVIPVIGSAIRCGISYYTTTAALTAVLKMMEKDALKVLQYVAKKTCSND